jgi:hypothetical protein
VNACARRSAGDAKEGGRANSLRSFPNGVVAICVTPESAVVGPPIRGEDRSTADTVDERVEVRYKRGIRYEQDAPDGAPRCELDPSRPEPCSTESVVG